MIQKNSYQAPHITVVHIQTASIIAATGQQGGPSAGFMEDPGISGNSSGNGVRASHSVFDDEDEDDLGE